MVMPLADSSPPLPTARKRRGSKDTLPKIYLASGFGAICLGLGDLINNDKAATVLKLGEVMRRNIYPGLESGGFLALLLLAFLGAGICWIHQPATRVDAFTRGFSVFAILAVVTPYQGSPAQQSTAGTTVRDSAVARAAAASVREFRQYSTIAFAATQALGGTEGLDEGSPEKKMAFITLNPSVGPESIQNIFVTIRDPESAKILRYEAVSGSKFSFSSPEGEYLIEVEAPGYRSTNFTIRIGENNNTYFVTMTKSAFPLSFQRLIGSHDVQPTKLNLTNNARCREFSVIQKRTFRIPGLGYTLRIGDMSDHKLRSLEVLRNNGASVKSLGRIKVNEEQLIYDGDVKLSLMFLIIEVSNLIPGVNEDSGLVTVCTDRWNDGTPRGSSPAGGAV